MGGNNSVSLKLVFRKAICKIIGYIYRAVPICLACPTRLAAVSQYDFYANLCAKMVILSFMEEASQAQRGCV